MKIVEEFLVYLLLDFLGVESLLGRTREAIIILRAVLARLLLSALHGIHLLRDSCQCATAVCSTIWLERTLRFGSLDEVIFYRLSFYRWTARGLGLSTALACSVE